MLPLPYLAFGDPCLLVIEKYEPYLNIDHMKTQPLCIPQMLRRSQPQFPTSGNDGGRQRGDVDAVRILKY